MPRFLLDCEENGPWGSWAYGGMECAEAGDIFLRKSTQSHEVELDIYDRLVDMQGTHVPTIFADVRLNLQHDTTGKDESLTQYSEVRAILMEYIPGFPLSDIVTEVLESDWAPICDQAIEVIRKITDNDFINFDIQTRNILVRRSEEGSYEVFYLNFGECGLRDLSDSDEIWRARKCQKNEEGAVDYIMMNYISRAKGKKGKPFLYPGSTRLPCVSRANT
jgi:hypothetical protein